MTRGDLEEKYLNKKVRVIGRTVGLSSSQEKEMQGRIGLVRGTSGEGVFAFNVPYLAIEFGVKDIDLFSENLLVIYNTQEEVLFFPVESVEIVESEPRAKIRNIVDDEDMML